MPRKTRAPSTEHPLALGSFRNWWALLRNSGGIDRRFLPRVLFVSLTTLLTSPFRVYERLRYRRLLRETAIDPAPIFIIGHWRTGTTHLHNLICQDSTLGYLSLFQSIAPGLCLTGERWLKPILAAWGRRAHPTRIIDNVPLAFDAPQEEEFAIATMSPHSFLHVFTLPQRARHFLEDYALFEDISPQARAEWAEAYLEVLRKATIRSSGKRLVLKNPANSGRIPAILDLFPGARFIHLIRNPYDVYLSNRWLWQSVVPRSQVQWVRPDQVEAYVLEFYERLMQQYLAGRTLIPAGHLVEIRFEDLETAPLEQMRAIYDGLGLPGYDQTEPAFRAYLSSINGYEKNEFELTRDTIATVNSHWGFAFEEWGYERLDAGHPSQSHRGFFPRTPHTKTVRQ